MENIISCEHYTDSSSFMQALIKEKKGRSNLSNSQIAKICNVSTSTIQRLENQETKNPPIESFTNVISGLLPDRIYRKEVIKKFYPTNYEKIYANGIENGFVDENVEHYFEDIKTYKIMLLAYSTPGTTKSFIQNQFGKEGLDTLNTLLEKNILNEVNGKIKASDKTLALSQYSSTKLLSNFVESGYDYKGFGIKENWLTLQSDTVNKKKFMPKLIERLRKFYKETETDLYNPEFSGNDLICIGMVADDITTLSSHQGGLQ